MSTFTTELRTIVESSYGQEEHLGYSQINSFLDEHANAFMPTYPIWSEDYRLILNKLILKHFWNREIAYEMPGKFMLALDEELNRWMPYYNLKFLAVHDLNEYLKQYGLRDKITERDSDQHHNNVEDFVASTKDTRTGTVDKSSDNSQSRTNVSNRETDRNDTTHTTNHTDNVGTNTDSSSTDRVEHQLYSDTPQGGLNGVEGHGQGTAVDDLYYLTNVTKNFGNENSKGKSQSSQTSSGNTDFTDTENSKEKTKGQEEVVNHTNDYTSDKSENNGNRKEQREITDINSYVEHIKGYTDFPAKKLADLTDELQDINSQIIRRLEPLFMQIWSDESNLGNGWFGMLPEHYYY